MPPGHEMADREGRKHFAGRREVHLHTHQHHRIIFAGVLAGDVVQARCGDGHGLLTTRTGPLGLPITKRNPLDILGDRIKPGVFITSAKARYIYRRAERVRPGCRSRMNAFTVSWRRLDGATWPPMEPISALITLNVSFMGHPRMNCATEVP